MSELREMAQPLLIHPLVDAPSIEDLRCRISRRNRRRITGGVASVGVVALTIVLLVALVPSSTPTTRLHGSSTLAAYIQQGVSVPDSTLEAVGLPASVIPPSSVPNQVTLTDQGKPTIVYVGAEFCPFCAMQRWALVVALSRFGTFSHLGQIISSSSTDVDPGLQSWSFEGSSFVSPSLTFDPAEVYSSTPTSTGNGYEPLQSLSPLQQTAYSAYDQHGGWPFLDIGNQFVSVGSATSPAVLEGLTLAQIASDLSDPSSLVAQAIDGTANYFIAAICSVTGSRAAPVCSAPMIAQAQATMASNPLNTNAG